MVRSIIDSILGRTAIQFYDANYSSLYDLYVMLVDILKQDECNSYSVLYVYANNPNQSVSYYDIEGFDLNNTRIRF